MHCSCVEQWDIISYAHVKTNFIPVLVCKHFNRTPPWISSMPSSAPAMNREKKRDINWVLEIKNRSQSMLTFNSHGFLFPGNRTGPASAAIACSEWKVLPIRSHSFVPMLGALGPSGRCRISPPDLFTMKRWRNPMIGIERTREEARKRRKGQESR
jgi:hypothetical protein